MIGTIALVLLFGFFLSIPILHRMHTQGKINIDKPEKRTYLYEDEDGNKDNPFNHPETEEDKESWKYSPEEFD